MDTSTGSRGRDVRSRSNDQKDELRRLRGEVQSLRDYHVNWVRKAESSVEFLAERQRRAFAVAHHEVMANVEGEARDEILTEAAYAQYAEATV